MCIRRFVALLLAVALVGISTHAFAASFYDVTGTQYETAYTYLSNKKVIQGYADGSGRPGHFLNRAEAVKVLMGTNQQYLQEVVKMQRNMPPLPLFTDIRQSQWFAPYVEAAFQYGIVKGYPDETFRPANLLTVEEAITILMRSANLAGDPSRASLSASLENRDSQWYTPSLNAAIERNLIMDQSMLRLGQPITRGQFFDIAYRLMSMQEQGAVAFGGEVERSGTIRAVQPVSNHHISVPQPAVVDHPYGSEKYFAISMPSLGIEDLTITHPHDPFTSDGVLSVLQQGVGHLFSYPGLGGKIMIYGHSSGYPWDVSQYTKIFRRVNELQIGDKIYVTYEGKLYTYEVTFEQTIDAADTTPFNDNGSGEELILYTCWPPDSIAQRYLVHASPVDVVALR